VLPTIQLHGKAGFVAVEIYNVRFNRVLPAELEACQTAFPQQGPKQLLGIGLLLAKLTSKLEEFWIERFFALTRPSATLSRRERVFFTPSPFGRGLG
jgi:hypothetical protein